MENTDKENMPQRNFDPPPTPLLKKIGFGTGVSVYHMDRSPLNHAVRSPWALKTVNRMHKSKTHFQERIENEAKILQNLNHPNIVGFRGFSKTEDGRKVLAMEECAVSLGDLIQEESENGVIRFGPDNILTVVSGVANALKYLHEEKKLLHGDLKSFNVLIKGDFKEIKLCDFGVSLELGKAQVLDYVGTGPWAAPEVMAEEDEEVLVTDRADVFSLGLVIWEMLTMKTPNLPDLSMSMSDSIDGSYVECVPTYGQSPELPPNLGSAYSLVTRLYEWCTRPRWQDRPTAAQILSEINQHGGTAQKAPPQIVL